MMIKKNKRKIIVVTGSRADYGLLKEILKKLNHDDFFDLKIVVTGSHLLKNYGSTLEEIENDGFEINKKVKVSSKNDTPLDLLKNIGHLIENFSKIFHELKPDILLILGDRYEIFACAQAAFFQDIIITHIHGGEITQGAIDDTFRHMITKMSHLHFVANKEYKKRVIQLGECPENIFDVGAPGIENLEKFLGQNKNFYINKNNSYDNMFLITFHPETMSKNKNENTIKIILEVLNTYKNTFLVFTYPNHDPDNEIIIRNIESFVKKDTIKRKIYKSLGQEKYWQYLRQADVVIGNSSSAIIEAPFLKVPTVNIGERQTGRVKATSIIDVKINKKDITKGIELALSKKFKETISQTLSLYGTGNVSKKIINQLKKKLPSHIKQFYDVKF